jgi:hypothetical protein
MLGKVYRYQYEVHTMAKSAKKIIKNETAKVVAKEDSACNYPHRKLWCITAMAAVIIVLTWLPTVTYTWSRIIMTVLAALIFARSMMVNCCK